jgi:hypothetical protein
MLYCLLIELFILLNAPVYAVNTIQTCLHEQITNHALTGFLQRKDRENYNQSSFTTIGKLQAWL